MRVLLLRDVPKIGKKGDTKEIADGYARNFLFPRKLAEPATDAGVARVAQERSRAHAMEAMRVELLEKTLSELSEKAIVLSARANEHGHLFASIGKDEIVAAVRAQAGTELLEKHLDLPQPIKIVGAFAIPVAVGKTKGIINLTIAAA